MKLAYKLSLAFLMLAGLICTDLAAKNRQEFTKTIKKEFDISQDGTTSITNKYGNVDIKTWDRNRVKIDVRIIVKANSEKTAQEVFDRVDINFSNGSSFVKAETEIESKSSKWWGWNNSKSDYAIHYEVHLPASNNLELRNKYGDVYAARMKGKINLGIKYGNFKLDGADADATIDLAYGNGSLMKARNVSVEIGYGKLKMEEVEDVDIDSKYSTLTVEKASNIKSYSKYDTYKIGSVGAFRNEGKYDNIDIEQANNIVITSKYTDFYVEDLERSLELDFEFGGAAVQTLSRGFNLVQLNGKYTDFKLGLESGAAYSIKATADYAGIRYPSGMTVTYEKEKGSYHEVEGHSGQQGTESVIKAKLNYGALKVKQD